MYFIVPNCQGRFQSVDQGPGWGIQHEPIESVKDNKDVFFGIEHFGKELDDKDITHGTDKCLQHLWTDDNDVGIVYVEHLQDLVYQGKHEGMKVTS